MARIYATAPTRGRPPAIGARVTAWSTGVRLENGRAAWYRNRWVRTESFEHPFPVYNLDGSRNLHSSIANTHVVRHADKPLR